MLVLNGKYKVVILDNLTKDEATKVRAALTSYFEDYQFSALYAGFTQYTVAASADGIIQDEREDQMAWFATGVIYGMK